MTEYDTVLSAKPRKLSDCANAHAHSQLHPKSQYATLARIIQPFPMNRTSHQQFRLVGATAETAVYGLHKVGWEAVTELSNVRAIDLDVVAEDDVHDLVVEEEEVLSDLGSARVLRV